MLELSQQRRCSLLVANINVKDASIKSHSHAEDAATADFIRGRSLKILKR